ncbi:MAG: amidohydrolase family protein [Alphaproteobacteria bacterium]|uniref:5-methylthioadenosine/S-adenosylhomocysteine deaminase n=1 Tax=Candidatus Nitrobium versatile TaxID=2884831 RepID=A0A953M381_9BACT|nr:amidohydrolase family protein [Candidatus Nitrobium versatile]
MESVDCILCGEYVLPMDSTHRVLRNGAVAVRDGVIREVGASEEILKRYTAPRIKEGRDRAVLPGLVNTHTHAAMVFFRGLADDLPLKDWLENHIWPAEGRWLSPAFITDAIELACLEMLKAGITTYSDMYFFGETTAVATKRMGMRAVLGAGIVDFPTKTGKNADDYLRNAEEFIADWKGDAMISPCLSPHSAYACSPETLSKIRGAAERWGVPISIHLSETEWEVQEILSRYGKRPVEHLDSLGLLSERLLAAHCVHLDGREIGLLSERGVGVSHCIESNLKLASGIAPVPEMLAGGIRVTFGTDGAASNNDLNVFSEMSTAAKLHKALAKDPTALDARTVLLMATRWGAEVLGLGATVGSIEEGKRADLITVDLRKPHLVPRYDIYSHLAYSTMASDVDTVLVDGVPIVENKAFLRGDEEGILHKAMQWGRKIALCNAHL